LQTQPTALLYILGCITYARSTSNSSHSIILRSAIDVLSGCQDIRKYGKMLENFHITKWDKDERWHGISLLSNLIL
jgi:hypothetical protein